MDFKLGALLQKVTQGAKRDLLASSFQFPRTASLANDTPYWVETVEQLNMGTYEDLRRNLQSNTEMIAIGARDDVDVMLTVLSLVHDELSLSQFDYIQIYLGGVDLLRIVNKSRQTKPSGRSAFVEINEYRRRLQGIFLERKEPSYVTMLAVGAALVGWAFNIYMWASKKV